MLACRGLIGGGLTAQYSQTQPDLQACRRWTGRCTQDRHKTQEVAVPVVDAVAVAVDTERVNTASTLALKESPCTLKFRAAPPQSRCMHYRHTQTVEVSGVQQQQQPTIMTPPIS